MGKSVTMPTRYLIVLVIGLLVSLSLSGVVAYNWASATPSVFGHTSNEIDVQIGPSVMDLQTAITSGALGGGSYNNIMLLTQQGQPFPIPAGGTTALVIAIGGGGGGGAALEGQGGGGASTTVTLNGGTILVADGGSGGSAPAPAPAVRAGTGGRGPNAAGFPGGLAGQIDGKGGSPTGTGGLGGLSLSTSCQGGNGGTASINNGAGIDPVVFPPLTPATDYSGWSGSYYGMGGTGAGSGQLSTSTGTNHDYGGGANGQDGAIAFNVVTLTDTDVLMASSIGGGGGGGAWDELNTWGGCAGAGASGVVYVLW